MTEPRIEVHADAATLATAVAGELMARLAAAQASGTCPQIGAHRRHHRRGRPPRARPALARQRGRLDRVVVWFGDERFVARRLPRPQRRPGPGGLPRRRRRRPAVHAMPSTADAADVDAAAAAYAATMRRARRRPVRRADAGHRSRRPRRLALPRVPALDVSDAIAVGVTGSPKPPPERVTLTYPALNRAESVWFLASGERQGRRRRRALADEGRPHDPPPRGVQRPDETIWFLDTPAASHL